MTSPPIDRFVFDRAFDLTLGHEGGYNEVKGDAGGATKLGVSLRYLRDQKVIDGDLDHDGDIDRDDIQLIETRHARELYYKDFWLKNNYDRLIDIHLACKIFDLCVNMGAKQANKLLQRAINDTAGRVVCTEDGICGLQTIKAANDRDPDIVLKYLKLRAAGFYTMLANNNPDLNKFLNGWLKRAAA